MDLSPFATLKVSFRSIGLGMLAVLPLLALLLGCQRITWRPIAEVRRVLDDLVAPMFKDCRWTDLLAISLIAAQDEELLFPAACFR